MAERLQQREERGGAGGPALRPEPSGPRPRAPPSAHLAQVGVRRALSARQRGRGARGHPCAPAVPRAPGLRAPAGQVRAGPSAFEERGAGGAWRAQTGRCRQLPLPLNPGRRARARPCGSRGAGGSRGANVLVWPGLQPLENSTAFVGEARVRCSHARGALNT